MCLCCLYEWVNANLHEYCRAKNVYGEDIVATLILAQFKKDNVYCSPGENTFNFSVKYNSAPNF
jgi:hypothetical protein